MAGNKFGSNPEHEALRQRLKKTGKKVLIAGLVMDFIGFIDLMIAMSTLGDPKLFGLLFLGAPVTFLGLAMLMFGYSRDMAQYKAEEIAPIAKDTFNYMAEGTQQGVKTMARAFKEGLSEDEPHSTPCPACGKANDSDAKFCNACGSSIVRACSSCGATNNPDARFCDSCGHALI